MDVKALAKTPAFIKYGEIIFGLLALSLYRAAVEPTEFSLEPWEPLPPKAQALNINEEFVVTGTLLGLFLSTLVFPFALLFGHKTGSMVSLGRRPGEAFVTPARTDHPAPPYFQEMIHAAVSAFFYLVSGSLLLKEYTEGDRTKEARMAIASGAFCILVTVVFIADAVFAAFKWRRDDD
ncbi:unnamed protein product [Darwinula stevensoni]|uniref:MARVEL domain-containing protein n=1 Tax=Darwinula stevensoni TaxID=69355 RepID=A0A7R9A546_9CRUS|nr:unnamed protein product [Darwinula stevensoni]CAG0893669.1 unnamed protein product [Darwinula stevensoni]